MRAILILLLSVITLSVTAQQRYRVTSKTDVQKGVNPMYGSIVQVYNYRYKQGADRGSAYTEDDDDMYYDTSLWYSLRGALLTDTFWAACNIRVYDDQGRVDSVFDKVYDYKGNVKTYTNVYNYDDKGRKAAMYVYAEVSTDSGISYTTVTDSGYTSTSVPYVKFGVMLIRKDTFVYDRNGDLLEKRKECMYSDCSATATKPDTSPPTGLNFHTISTCTYDANRNRLNEKTVSSKSGVELSSTVYFKHYDSLGRLKSRIHIKYEGGKQLLIDSSTVSYEGNKRIINELYVPYYSYDNTTAITAGPVQKNQIVQYYDTDDRVIKQVSFSYSNATGMLIQKTDLSNQYDANDRITNTKRHIYSISGKPTKNALLDTDYVAKETERVVETTSYTSFGYISAYVKQYYHIEEDTAYKTEKTTYTYEAY